MKESINKGFTLIELIVVISIISIITLIATPNYLKYRDYVIREEAINIGKGIYLSTLDYYHINSKYSIDSKYDVESIKKFIQVDVGIPIEGVEKQASEDYILDINYYSRDSICKCEVNLEGNKFKIFYIKDNGESLIYKNY